MDVYMDFFLILSPLGKIGIKFNKPAMFYFYIKVQDGIGCVSGGRLGLLFHCGQYNFIAAA